jgi:hypothetical protein
VRGSIHTKHINKKYDNEVNRHVEREMNDNTFHFIQSKVEKFGRVRGSIHTKHINKKYDNEVNRHVEREMNDNTFHFIQSKVEKFGLFEVKLLNLL